MRMKQKDMMIMKVRRIILGLPKGSLNTEGRGDTNGLLEKALYGPEGLIPGHEELGDRVRFRNDPEIRPFVLRAQDIPGDLNRKVLDIAIVGDDWVREESGVITRPLIKLADLEYGRVSLVAAVLKENPVENLDMFFESTKGRNPRAPVLIYTSFVKLTRDKISANASYRSIFGNVPPSTEAVGLREKGNNAVQIVYVAGSAEGYLRRGVDLVVDVTQSGESLRSVGAKVIDTFMTSTAGLYARPGIKKDSWLWEKANAIKDMLRAATTAEKYLNVIFHIPVNQKKRVEEFISHEKLARLAPSIQPLRIKNKLVGYAVHIMTPQEGWPRIHAILKKEYGATAIGAGTLNTITL